MKKVLMIVFLAMMASFLFGQFENSIITCSSASVNEGEDFDITISTTELQESWNITAFQFELDFNPDVVSYSGFEAGEVVAGGGSLLANESTPGHIIVAYAHYIATSGVGNLVTLSFSAADIGTTTLDLNDFKYNATYLASGNLIDGVAQVTEYNPFQDVVITAGSGNVTVGNTIEIPVSTTMLTSELGAISFQFDLDFDPELVSYTSATLGEVPNAGSFIANVSAPGVLSVAYANVSPIVGEGTLCVITLTGEAEGTSALDLNEFKYNSNYLNNLEDGTLNVVEFNPFEEVVITAGSASAAIGGVVEVPISTTAMTSDMGAIAFQFNLTYDNSILTFDSAALGEVPNPGNFVANEATPGVISIAYANVSPIVGEGNLCYLTFAADASGSSDLVLSEFKYNSNYLSNLVNGVVDVSAIQYPDWTVNPPDYEYNGSIWGIVLLDDVEVVSTDGMLGCFVGDECRGIASFEDGSLIDYTVPFGHTIFLPMVYSNETSGETLDFLYFDPFTEEIYPIAESIEWVADMVIGNGFDPFEFHASTVTTVDLSKDIVSGWNWFSVNVVGEDMGVNSVLSSIGNSGANIKNQSQSAIYYEGAGWFGSLNTINNLSLYKLEANTSATWEYTGTPVDLAETTYSLNSGWNWISYAPQEPEAINYALGELENGANIKNQSQSAIYYEGAGWFGSLNTLNPTAGYMLQMNESEEHNYPEPGQEPVAAKTVESLSADDLAISSSNDMRDPDWELYVPAYQYNGSIWAIVEFNGVEVTETSGMLGCFVGDECRGIASEADGSVIDYTVPFGHTIFLPMVYSNVTAGETITFKYWDANTDMVFDAAETVEWEADMVIGDGFNPFVITVESGGNLPPAANAGIDQVVTEGDLVTLDGSASTDPEGDALTYQWTAPEGITLDDDTAVMPTFTAPDVDMNMDYCFTLVVNDGEFDSMVDTVMVTVENIWVFEETMITVGSADVMELEEFSVPVCTTPLDSLWAIIAYQFDLEFDPEVISYQGFSMGDVPNGGSIIANELEPGHIRVAYAHYLPVIGEGSLCNIDFQAVGIGGSSDLHVYEFKYNQTYMTNLVDGVVNVTPLENHPPTIMLPDAFYFVTNETLTVDFSEYVEDVDGDVLTLTPSGNTDIMLDVDGLMVEMSAPLDWTGTENVTFVVDDGYSGRDIAFDDVDIVVTLPEPELEIDLPNSLSLVSETATTIDFEEYIYYMNINPADLTLTVEGNSNIGVNIDEFDVTFTSNTWLGTEEMTFTVSDGTRRIASSDMVMVSVVDFENSVITVNNVTADDGSDFDVCISSSIVDASWNVIAFQCSLAYDTNYLTWNEITVENTIASAGQILGNEIEPGLISFAYMHYLPLEGEGPICYLNFTAHGIGETVIDIWDFKYNSTYMFDENLHDGIVTLNDTGIQYVPIADAGEDQAVIGGNLVTLDGSGSFDMNGDDLSYEWTAPAGITLSDPNAMMPTFMAPVNATVMEYDISLEVTDDDGTSDPDVVTITVTPPNMPPVADAGDDVMVYENMTVTLDGSNSYDPDGDPITFLWEATGLTFDDPTSATPTITAPEVDEDTEFTVTLTVSDALASGTDEVVVMVMNVEVPLVPPTNLAVENLDDGEALFTWDPPAEAGVYIHYDSGENDDGIGLTAGGDFMVAAKWDAGDLDDYDGLTITKLNFFFNDADCSFTAKIWTGANAGTEVVSQAIAAPMELSWNEIILDTPFTIDSSDEIWVGYAIVGQVAGSYPAGCDAGPAIAGYGDMISTNGTTWDPLSGFGLDYNWNIQAWVAGATEAFELPAPVVQNTITSVNNSGIFATSGNTSNGSSRLTRELTGYNVYLDNAMMGFVDVATTEYTFTGLNDGTTYEAGVVAVYDEGYSTMPTVEFTYVENMPPVADAGDDMSGRDGVVITLDGTASYDPDGDDLDYSWTAPAGITLNNPSSATPSFTAPEVTEDTEYTFTLEVDDGDYTDTDQVVITVQDDEPIIVDLVHLTDHYVQLTWEAPGIGPETGEYIHWDSGMNDDGIGLTGGGSFMVAARWDAGDLADYDGLQITKLKFFPRSALCDYELKIWTGANASTEILTQPVTDFTIETWNEIYLTTAYTIDSSVELWVGYNIIDHPDAEFPAGCDAGPAIAGYGDMISTNGSTWDELSGFGLDYNWNIQAFVAGAETALPLAAHSETPEVPAFMADSEVVFAEGNLPIVDFDTRDERSFLLGFNVYLDDDIVAEVDIDETSHIFMNVYGDHECGVQAVYNDGESEIATAEIVSDDINQLPIVTELNGNYPNPFNPETTIKMSLAESGQTRLDIFNVRGQKVRTLVNEHMEAGNHDIVWRGLDDNGKSVGSGVYFYKMKLGKYTSTKKMILMK